MVLHANRRAFGSTVLSLQSFSGRGEVTSPRHKYAWFSVVAIASALSVPLKSLVLLNHA
jgi:hypothetical protein